MQAPARFSAVTGGASYAIYLSHILILTVVWNTGFNQFIGAWSGSMIIAAYILLMLFILGTACCTTLSWKNPCIIYSSGGLDSYPLSPKGPQQP